MSGMAAPRHERYGRSAQKGQKSELLVLPFRGHEFFADNRS